MSLSMKNIILSPKSSLTHIFLGEILSPNSPKENWEKENLTGFSRNSHEKICEKN